MRNGIPMKPRGDAVDVVILGSGLGGLIAGTLLSRNGVSVLLVKEKGFEPTYSSHGFTFIPFSNFSEIRLKTGLVDRVSRALDLSPAEGQEKSGAPAGSHDESGAPGVSFQVILPKSRIDLSSVHSLLQREWSREFPKEVSRIETLYQEMTRNVRLLHEAREREREGSVFPFRHRSFFRRVIPSGGFPGERVHERLSSFSREFGKFIQLQLLSLGNLCSDRIPLSLAASILLEAESERAPLSYEKFAGKVMESFVQSGGEVERVEGLEGAAPDGEKGVTLSSRRGEKVFRSDRMIITAPLHRVAGRLSRKRNPWSKWVERIRPRFVLVPFFLGIREEVIPVGMSDLLVSIADLDRSPEEGNLLLISLSPKGDETRAPLGKRALTVESLISLDKWEEEFLMDYPKGVMSHLDRLFPFLEDHMEFTHGRWADDQIPCWSYPHFLYETSADFNWKEGVVPTRLSPKVYFVGKENFPYLGLEGEVIGGLMVAQQILKKYR